MKAARCVILVALCVHYVAAVTSAASEPKEARNGFLDNAVSHYNLDSLAEDVLQCNPRGNSFFTPSGSSEQGLGECLKRRAVTHLLGLSTAYSPVGLSESVSLVPEPGAARAIPHYSEPPSLVEAMRHFLGHRVMRWQLDTLYPGLVMRLGPMGVPDSGVLEFVLERLYDDTDRAFGPGKLLIKRTVLPLLLGFKLKLSTLMPILLGGFFFLATKALFFSKLAIMVGAMIGFKALLFGGSPLGFGGGHHYPLSHGHTGGLLDLFTGGGHYHNPYGPVSFKSADADHRNVQSFESTAEALDPQNDNIPRDITGSGGKVSASMPVPIVIDAPIQATQQTRQTDRQYVGKRNFAWDDRERG
ncbi:hypothetical protein B566_EDAN008114 [Ephemera danica]|nr:hypothetical protein B566_EDAN008114 [Ephemera danica]